MVNQFPQYHVLTNPFFDYTFKRVPDGPQNYFKCQDLFLGFLLVCSGLLDYFWTKIQLIIYFFLLKKGNKEGNKSLSQFERGKMHIIENLALFRHYTTFESQIFLKFPHHLLAFMTRAQVDRIKRLDNKYLMLCRPSDLN